MTPLNIVFHLVTPMVLPENPIHLDALLAWAAVDAAGGDLTAQDDLPLEKAEQDGAWVWKASMVRIGPVRFRDNVPMTRSFEPWQWGADKDHRFEGGPNIVTGGTGAYKAYLFTRHTGMIDTAHASCVGDLDAVRALLNRVTHLGKLARLDHGRIARIEITPDAAPDAWMHRVLPWPHADYLPSQECVHPPYWKRSEQVFAWRPRALP